MSRPASGTRSGGVRSAEDAKPGLRLLQHALLVVGGVLLTAWALAQVDGAVSSRLALKAFDQAAAAAPATTDENRGSPPSDEPVDFGLWDPKRIRGYKESLEVDKRSPWGVLSIEKLRLQVPVFDGTDDLTLNRGAGWILGTARPGEPGNIGIAGHRDGFFRGLKDVAVGDAVALKTAGGRALYAIDEIEIVSPDRVDVLKARPSPSLTLVTCYPFYFIGPAPQRFIVHAKLETKAQ
jgi:sortase A